MCAGKHFGESCTATLDAVAHAGEQDSVGGWPALTMRLQLDELFGEGSDLDFFILFSSLANTVGNRGQSNYLAANGYMQTIAAQRRARGLTASVMHIGMVIGIGVVSQDAALESSLKRQKWMAISEPALYGSSSRVFVPSRDLTLGPCFFVRAVSSNRVERI